MEFLIGPLNSIGDGIDSLKSNITSIPSTIINGIKDLFIPDPEFFQDKFDELKLALESRLSISSYIALVDSIKSASAGGFQDVTVTIMGSTSTIIDSEPINQNLSVIKDWIRGFIFVLLVFYNINQILKLIRGTDYIGTGGTNLMGYHVGKKGD